MDDEALPQAQFEIGEDDDMDNTDLLCSPSNDNDDNDDNDDEDMSDATLLEPQSGNATDEADNDTLLKAQFDLFKFLVHYAQASAEPHIAADPTLLTLQVQHDLEKLARLSTLIDKVERHG